MHFNLNEQSEASNFFKKIEGYIKDFVYKQHSIIIVLIFFTSFLLKLSIVKYNNMLGADYGTYLRWADVLRGSDIVGKGLRYPPIYPTLLALFLTFLDEITALEICAAFLYSIIAIPYFLFAKKIFGNGLLPLIASILITFNIFYSEMMGWGGNANVLAFVFLITFLIFWIKSLEDNGKGKDMFLAAIFITFAIGSHYLLAAHLLLFFFIFLFQILLLWWRRPKTLAFGVLIKKVLIIGLTGLMLSIPYLFTYKHLLHSAVFYEINFLLADQRVLGLSLYLLYKNMLNIVFLVLGVIGILFLTKEGKFVGFTLSALFISACLPMLFTLHPVRWVYFWPISIFLGFAAFSRKLILKLRIRKTLWAFSIACLTFLIFTYAHSSTLYLHETVSYYNVLTPQLLDALNYLRSNTTFSSVIATSGPHRRGGEGSGHNYGWWIEGYADRRSVATAYLRFLIYYDEREIAKKANILFSGTHVLLNDFVMVAETLPASLGNPEIGINIGDFYDKLLLFADNEVIITYCNNYNTTLRGLKMKTTPVVYGGSDGVNITYFYDSTTFNKVFHILDSTTIEVLLKINSDGNMNITRIYIPLFKADFVDLNTYHESNGKIVLEMTTSMGAYVKLNVAVDYAGDVTVTRSGKEQEVATFIFDVHLKSATIKFTFSLPKLINIGSCQVQYFNAYELIEQMEIDYIMINISRYREFEWLSNDKSRFSKDFGKGTVAIFKVIRSQP